MDARGWRRRVEERVTGGARHEDVYDDGLSRGHRRLATMLDAFVRPQTLRV